MISKNAAADTDMPKAWHLLVSICYGMAVAGAFSYAKVQDAGVRAWALVIPLSVMIGVACACVLEIARARVAAHVTRTSGSVPGWFSHALYVAAMVWMVVAWVLGLLISAAVLRLLR